MKHRTIVTTVLLLMGLVLAACTTVAPAAAPDTAADSAPAADPEPTAEPTEEPMEEASSESEMDETAVYTVDTEASQVEWYGSKPIGASESGTVNIVEGQLSFDGSELIEGKIVIDMTSIATTSQNGGMAERLVGHLSSDDFFSVANYPTATLVIKSAEPTGTENQYQVTGELTIKETTDEITFLTDVAVGDGTLEATADIVVDRSIYDVRYNSGTFFSDLGDDLISDEMEFTVSLVANK